MNNRHLHNLISRWLNEAIEPEEFRELQEALKESADARDVYLDYMSVNAGLCKLFSLGAPVAEDLIANGPIAEDVEFARAGGLSGRSITIVPRAIVLLAFAAGLLLALGIWRGAGLWEQELGKPELAQGGLAQGGAVSEQLATDEPAMEEPAILTQIQPVSDTCRWYTEPAQRAQAESYRTGDIIRVTSGKLSLQYPCGTTVVLHSPSAYQLISNQDAKMLVGRLTATVSEAGKGFSVVTPRMTVIDLGTQFGIEVDNYGATDLVVFKGEVDVDYHDDQVSTQRLTMGEAVHLDEAGTNSRIVSINHSTYASSSLQEPSRPPVITQVRDNIRERDAPEGGHERETTLSYYEIVHGGMREDVFAYVDRPLYQYMGLTDEGMPPYLMGGDYVKMFNDDKTDQGFQIQVELAVPAKLYVLLDKKISPPPWLRRDFHNTGDYVGMDRGIPRKKILHEGVLEDSEIPSGALPHVRTNMVIMFSVWVCDSVEAGVLTLGATEVNKDASNMYGIVAVPLEETHH